MCLRRHRRELSPASMGPSSCQEGIKRAQVPLAGTCWNRVVTSPLGSSRSRDLHAWLGHLSTESPRVPQKPESEPGGPGPPAEAGGTWMDWLAVCGFG